MEIKNDHYGRVSDYASKVGGSVKFHPGVRPWFVKVDVALPCACENELNGESAADLPKNCLLYTVDVYSSPFFTEFPSVLLSCLNQQQLTPQPPDWETGRLGDIFSYLSYVSLGPESWGEG